MTLFTSTDREAIKNDLIGLLSSTLNIKAVILIGSAVKGYTDELSDINIMSVVSSESDTIRVMATIYEGIKARYNILCFAPLNERGLQVCLLDNYLELNFSYRTLETLVAKSASWQIMHNETGLTDSIMRTTFAKFDEANHISTKNNYQSKLAGYSLN